MEETQFYHMPVQKFAVVKNRIATHKTKGKRMECKKVMYLYDKEFALKTYTIIREPDYYKNNGIDKGKQLMPGVTTKGNEILVDKGTNLEKKGYYEVWANKTKYQRTKGLGRFKK